jgi:hypothetical protein
MFGTWLKDLNSRLKSLIWVEACALCWAIWLSRNVVVFDNAQVSTPLQVALDKVLNIVTERGGQTSSKMGLSCA